ncbi:MAG: retropepsin-like aspartic protease [Bacteroidota bacterium]
MKLRYSLAVLPLLFITYQNVHAQRAVQTYYLQASGGESPTDWFTAYRQANYAAAYRTLMETSTPPPRQQFLTNANLYANQQGNIPATEINNWGMEFYRQYAQPTATWGSKKTVSLPLERNLFQAVIGQDTLRVIFDTGGQGISISRTLVEKYGYPSDTTISGSSYMPAFKRTSTQSPTVIEKISFGSLQLHNLRAKFTTDVVEEGKFDSQQAYEVFMGIDVLIGLVDFIRFDWETNELILAETPLSMANPQDFFFFDAKPITVLTLNEKPLTTLLDTGSPVDILNFDQFKDSYTKKEDKKYGDYAFSVYTVPITVGNAAFNLGVADYMEGFNLKLDEEIIDLIIGTKHRRLSLDLKHNMFELE